MNLSVYLPLLLTAAFGFVAPGAAHRLPPAVATWLLGVGGLLAATASAAALALLGITLVGQSPLLAAEGHWSHTALRHVDPVSVPLAAAALAVLAVLAGRVLVAGLRRATALRDAFALAAGLPAAGGELAVLDDPWEMAYAVPGRPGRIAVSAALLRRLDAAERRALLAHERSHLVHHHHVHQSLAVLAAAANPLLYRLPDAVALSTERWADEDAAGTGRRGTVATLLTRTAAAAGVRTRPAVVLAAARTHVTARVAALHAPAPRLAVWRVGVLLGLLAASAAALLNAANELERVFEFAQSAYLLGGR